MGGRARRRVGGRGRMRAVTAGWAGTAGERQCKQQLQQCVQEGGGVAAPVMFSGGVSLGMQGTSCLPVHV